METFLQIGLNSFCSGLILSLVAIGFSYIFHVTKVFHLAHASLYALSGLLTWSTFQISNSFIVSLFVSLFFCCLIIIAIEKLIYLPLCISKANESISLISSMGIYVVIINLLAIFYGNENRIYDIESSSLSIGALIITLPQQWQISFCIITLLLSYIFLRKNNLNLDFRAISDSEETAALLGININQKRLISFLFGTILIVIASWLLSLEIGIEPNSGMHIILTAAAISIFITRLNILLLLVGSIVLSIVQNGIEWHLNAQWRDGLTFFLLLLVIIYRTEGLVNYKLRKDSL